MKRFVLAWVWLSVLLLVGTVAGADKTFTLEQVLSAPFPDSLTSAPASVNRVAFGFNARGQRNVWVADGPQLRARQATFYTADDGQEVGQFSFSRDARTVVYVRGQFKNAKGESPNPTSNPAGAEEAIWAISVDGGPPRRLAPGSAPTVSPASGRVAFVRDGQVWIVEITGSSEAAPFFHARGTIDSLQWSPDGSRLAFVSHRGDHSLIGVYDTRAGSVRYLAPSVDLDSEPHWSPDGTQLAFIRVPTNGTTERNFWTDPDTDITWSLWVASAETGEGREVWRSPSHEGGTLSAYLDDSALAAWAADNRLVFRAELDGWNRLYSVPASSTPGAAAMPLSPANCEVESLALTPDRRDVYFSSNCGDIEHRHLWRVSVSEGAPRQLTSGNSAEVYPQVLADGKTVVCLGADARHPLAPQVLENGKLRSLAPEAVPAEFPQNALVEPKVVTFRAADGWDIHAQMLDAGAAKTGAKRPALIFVHGGPIRQMLPGWHYMYYYSNAYGFNQYMASRGYVVLSVNFRTGIGYGRLFRNAPKRGAQGASEYQDVVAAAQFLGSRPDVDPARIAIWGGSYGGYLTAMALARNSDLFAAGVDLHGVHDWAADLGAWSKAPGNEGARKIAFESSPIASVKTWRSPVLLIHGDDDRNVAFSQTADLVVKLREQKTPFEQLIFPDEIHDFLRHATWLEAYHAAERFLDQHLRGAGR